MTVLAPLSTCPTCSKVRYTSKRSAKAAIRQFPRREGRLHAYRCGEYWHIGHMPKNVAAGKVSRAVITPNTSRKLRKKAQQ